MIDKKITLEYLKKNAPKGEFPVYINKKEAAALKRAGGSGHLVNGIPSFVGSDYSGGGKDGKKGTNTSGYQGGNRGSGGYQGTTGKTNQTVSQGGSGSGNFNPNVTPKGTPVLTGDLSTNLQTFNNPNLTGILQPMGPPIYSPTEQVFGNFLNTRKKIPDVPITGPLSLVYNAFKKPIQKFADFSSERNRPFFENVIRSGKYTTPNGLKVNFGSIKNMTPAELENTYKQYHADRHNGVIDAAGNPKPTGSDRGGPSTQDIDTGPVDYGPMEGMTYSAVQPQPGFRYIYDQYGRRSSIPIEGYTGTVVEEESLDNDFNFGTQSNPIYSNDLG
tara:strand:- start:37 stop:1029 length:993 start_codon:yes stop_codon:yes gene_type:complete